MSPEITAHAQGARMFRLTPTNSAMPRAPRDCSSLVALAGRMGVSADYAIHEFIDHRLRQRTIAATPIGDPATHPNVARTFGMNRGAL
jgi:hypothetical protein